MDLYFMLRGNNTLTLIAFPLKTFKQTLMSLKKEYYKTFECDSANDKTTGINKRVMTLH